MTSCVAIAQLRPGRRIFIFFPKTQQLQESALRDGDGGGGGGGGSKRGGETDTDREKRPARGLKEAGGNLTLKNAC